MRTRTQIHALLLQAAQKHKGLKAEYYQWAAEIVGRRLKRVKRKQQLTLSLGGRNVESHDW